MADAREVVDSFIKAAPVVVFSKSYCPYCQEALRLLNSLVSSDKLKVVELTSNEVDAPSIQKVLGEITGRTTVPRVFVGGVSVGGCDDTVAANKSGKLKQLLQQAGAL